MQTLIVWLLDGKELRFKNVKNFKENSYRLLFEYDHLGFRMNTCIDKVKILGHSIGRDNFRSELDGLVDKL